MLITESVKNLHEFASYIEVQVILQTYFFYFTVTDIKSCVTVFVVLSVMLNLSLISVVLKMNYKELQFSSAVDVKFRKLVLKYRTWTIMEWGQTT